MLRKKTIFTDLPMTLQAKINQLDFIKAYYIKESNSFIVWIVNRQTKLQQELEFSLLKERFLSREERESNFAPCVKEIIVDDKKLKVEINYKLSTITDVLYELYVVYDKETSEKLAECSQLYYSAVPPDYISAIKERLEELEFPMVYSKWTVEEKVRYWTVRIYRFRRMVGEQGCEENDVFEKRLYNNMKKIDSNIDNILPLILNEIAEMDRLDPVALIDDFNKRTGLSVSLLER